MKDEILDELEREARRASDTRNEAIRRVVEENGRHQRFLLEQAAIINEAENAIEGCLKLNQNIAVNDAQPDQPTLVARFPRGLEGVHSVYREYSIVSRQPEEDAG